MPKDFYEEQRDQGYYAVARWSIEDIHEYRKDNDLPAWTDDAAEEWLFSNEERIADRMIEQGWEIIASSME